MNNFTFHKQFLAIFLMAATILTVVPGASIASADERDTSSPYGMLTFLPWNQDWNHFHYKSTSDIKKAIQLMKEAGVGIVRMDFSWKDIEPVEGKFNFRRHDKIVDLLLKSDIKVMGILHYSPKWTGKEWNDPPVTELFLKYARETVSHFKDRVKYWEVWNEPDVMMYWNKRDDMKSYTALLKATYPVIKEEDPTSVVLMGSIAKHLVFSLKSIYRNGGKDYFDIVNIHPFVDPKQNNAMQSMKNIYKGVVRVMGDYLDSDKKIWITEIGCPGRPSDQESKGWWSGVSTTQEEQKTWLADVYSETLTWPGIEKVFWAFFRDTIHFGNDVDTFGIVTKDFKIKPAYEAYRVVTKEKQ